MGLRARILEKFPSLNGMSEGFLLWGDVEDLDDAGVLVARWLRQDLRYLPWDSNTPYAETLEAEGFAEAMAQVNDLGIVTTCSQPGTPLQREFVSLALEDDLLPLVEEVARDAGVEVEVLPEKSGSFKEATPVTLNRRGSPHTRLGESREIVAGNFGYGSRVLGSAITGGQYTLLALYDKEFERRGRVQEALEHLRERVEARLGAGTDAQEAPEA